MATYDLDDMVKHAVGFAKDCLIGKPGAEIVSMFDIVMANGHRALAMTPWADEDEKNGMLDALEAKMAKERAVAYLSLSEAWVSHVPADTKQEDIIPPSQDPKRREVVMIAATDGQIVRQAMLEIKRDEKGVVVALEEEKDGGKMTFGGRMLSLLGGPERKRQFNA